MKDADRLKYGDRVVFLDTRSGDPVGREDTDPKISGTILLAVRLDRDPMYAVELDEGQWLEDQQIWVSVLLARRHALRREITPEPSE